MEERDALLTRITQLQDRVVYLDEGIQEIKDIIKEIGKHRAKIEDK